MLLERVCVMCAKALEPPGRCDRRYCGRLCRLQAFRARQKQGVSHGPRAERTRRSLTCRPDKLLDATRSQLDLFRELRQARKYIAELTAQSAQAQKGAERQRREQEQARRSFDESAQAERAQLESKLAEAAAQREQDAKTIEAHATELRCANERISEVIGEMSRASALRQSTLARLHDMETESSRQLVAADTARDAAQEQAQTYKEAAAKAEDERETAGKWVLEQLAGLWGSHNSEREEHAQKLAEMEHQLGAAKEQAAALQARLERAELTVRQQRDQLDDTALALSEARAAADPAIQAVKLAQAQSAVAEGQRELAVHSRRLQVTRQEFVAATKSLSEAQERTRALEAEIAKLKDATVAAALEHQSQFDKMLEANGLLRNLNDRLRAQRRF